MGVVKNKMNLNRFVENAGIGEVVKIEKGAGGLPLVQIHNTFADCDIYSYGAHVARFVPRGGRDILWMSPYSRFEEGIPIRGGIPIIFPWFSEHRTRKDLQLHGFVRTCAWDMVAASQLPDGRTQVVFSIKDNERSREIWPFRFRLELEVTVGPALTLALTVWNRSESSFMCENGFHTYFSVNDVRQCQIVDFDGMDYIDRARGGVRMVQHGPVRFGTETIQAYMRVPVRCELHDTLSECRILVHQEGMGSVVLWNPGEAAAAKNEEIRDAWARFVCIESTNCLDRALTIPAGEAHRSTVTLSVAKE